MSIFLEALEVYEAFKTGFEFGDDLNELFVQDLIDQAEAGSGDAGGVYLDFINEHGDPLEVIEMFGYDE